MRANLVNQSKLIYFNCQVKYDIRFLIKYGELSHEGEADGCCFPDKEAPGTTRAESVRSASRRSSCGKGTRIFGRGARTERIPREPFPERRWYRGGNPAPKNAEVQGKTIRSALLLLGVIKPQRPPPFSHVVAEQERRAHRNKGVGGRVPQS